MALECLERLGIGALRDRPFSQLSGGEQQLVLTPRRSLRRKTPCPNPPGRMHAGNLVLQPAALGLRILSDPARRRTLPPAQPQRRDRRRPRRLRDPPRHRNPAHLRRPLGQRRPALRRRLATALRRVPRSRCSQNRPGRRPLHLAARRHGRRRRTRSRRLPARACPRHGGTGQADRHLARPARHSHRQDDCARSTASPSTTPTPMSISPTTGERAARLLLDIIDRGLDPPSSG